MVETMKKIFLLDIYSQQFNENTQPTLLGTNGND